jgi:hypothetical protein
MRQTNLETGKYAGAVPRQTHPELSGIVDGGRWWANVQPSPVAHGLAIV